MKLGIVIQMKGERGFLVLDACEYNSENWSRDILL